MRRLGEKIRTLRKRKGMTLKQTAMALGFPSHSYMSEIETGKKTPPVELLIKISDLFEVTIDQLLRDHQEV